MIKGLFVRVLGQFLINQANFRLDRAECHKNTAIQSVSTCSTSLPLLNLGHYFAAVCWWRRGLVQAAKIKGNITRCLRNSVASSPVTCRSIWAQQTHLSMFARRELFSMNPRLSPSANILGKKLLKPWVSMPSACWDVHRAILPLFVP